MPGKMDFKPQTPSVQRQPRSAVMPLPRPKPNNLIKAGHDGYRTPIIEDPEHPSHPWNRSRGYQHSAPGFPFLSPSRLSPEVYHGRVPRIQEGVSMDHPSQSCSNESDDTDKRPKHLPWRRRMKHVTWAWFTISMATGGIANIISAVPFRFHGLREIGLVFFFLNIVLYLIIWAMIITRFTLYPYTFKASFTHPTESLFVPAFSVSFGTILITIVEYGFGEVGTWLNRAVLVLFWVDAALAVILSIGIYLILWSTQSFTIARMTPIWIFPAYPLLIIGPHAANLSQRVSPPTTGLRVIIGGFTIQGIGMLVSLAIYSAFVYRLMTQKLPAEPLRPAMFVSVGPAAFTVSGVIGMAANLARSLSPDPHDLYMGLPSPQAAGVLRIVANWVCLWLWGLAFWFFFVSLAANLTCLRDRNHQIPFAMAWFSFVFPQTALSSATLRVGDAFQVRGIQWIGCIMVILTVVMWIFVMSMTIRAIVIKQILWPGKGEDRDEGGFEGFKEKKGQQSAEVDVENGPEEEREDQEGTNNGRKSPQSNRRNPSPENELGNPATSTGIDQGNG